MSRVPELNREDLDTAGQRLYDEILAARGSIAGPFRVWLHSPEFTRRATQLGEFLRYHTMWLRCLTYTCQMLLSPVLAGAAISLSSVSVIANALRLRKVML